MHACILFWCKIIIVLQTYSDYVFRSAVLIATEHTYIWKHGTLQNTVVIISQLFSPTASVKGADNIFISSTSMNLIHVGVNQ